jgi:hypothetical protein
LHNKLGQINEFKIDIDNIDAPFVYPLLCAGGKEIRDNAIDKKIFIDTYWDRVLNKVNRNSVEARLTNDLLPLPVSQMYNLNEMDYLGNSILNYYRHTNINP